MKNLRNNWFSETTGCIKYPVLDKDFAPYDVSMWKVARWAVLKELRALERDHDFKSPLTDAAISPNNFEKQLVLLALQVFNEKTVSCLRTLSATNTSDRTRHLTLNL